MIRLKELREKNNLKQKDIAEILNVSNKSICAYENGNAEPKIETLIKMCEYFNCSLDYLLGKEQDKGTPKITLEEKTVLNNYNKLNKTNKVVVSNFIKLTLEMQNK